MKLFFRKLGQGRPVFIVHGLFGLSDNWNWIGKMLSEAQFPSGSLGVYLLDLRNHGSSPHSDEWNYSAMANDIAELMRDEDLDKIILMGHSLGGKVSMQFAGMFPDKLEKLIIADMAPKEYIGNQFSFIEKLPTINMSLMASRKDIDTELRKIIRDEATIQLLLKNITWKETLDANGNKIGKDFLDWKFNLKVLASQQDEIGKTFILREVNIPTLFIRGGRSKYLQDSDFPLVKKYFPHSEIATIQDADHWLHAERPKEYLEIVERFIG